MIHVHLNQNGDYWQHSWTDQAGKRHRRGAGKRKDRGGDVTKRDAQRARIALEQELNGSSFKAQGGKAPGLGEWCEWFLDNRPMADATRVQYDQTIGLMLEHFGDVPIDAISATAAAEFRGKLLKQVGEQTVCKHVRHAKPIFEAAVTQEIIQRSPFRSVSGSPPRSDKDWRYVTLDELDGLLEACPSGGWRRYLALMRLAGLRSGEALRLRWGDVAFDAHTLRVAAKDGKATTKSRSRTVPVCPQLMGLLVEGMDGADGELVAEIPEHNRHRQFAAILERSGIDPWDKAFHTLRKNCETDWLARCPVMDVCDWLGHSAAVASKHYHQTKASSLGEITGKARYSVDDAVRVLSALSPKERQQAIAIACPKDAPSGDDECLTVSVSACD